MQFLVAALIGGLWQVAGSLVGRVLVSLGIGYLVFSGLDASIGWMKVQVVTKLAGLGAQTVATMGALQIGRCISIICSALVMRLTMQGMQSGVIKKMVTK